MASSIRALLVDDEEVYVESLAKVLRVRGIDAGTATSGAAALQLLQREQFDVIVLDVRMPRMDGVATLGAIRERDAVTPVLLLSGQADLEQATAALKLGATDVLVKPCAIDTLKAAIEDAAELKAAARAVADAGVD